MPYSQHLEVRDFFMTEIRNIDNVDNTIDVSKIENWTKNDIKYYFE